MTLGLLVLAALLIVLPGLRGRRIGRSGPDGR